MSGASRPSARAASSREPVGDSTFYPLPTTTTAIKPFSTTHHHSPCLSPPPPPPPSLSTVKDPNIPPPRKPGLGKTVYRRAVRAKQRLLSLPSRKSAVAGTVVPNAASRHSREPSFLLLNFALDAPTSFHHNNPTASLHICPPNVLDRRFSIAILRTYRLPRKGYHGVSRLIA
jgi:hypothetical protein